VNSVNFAKKMTAQIPVAEAGWAKAVRDGGVGVSATRDSDGG